ncbi:MAG: hypothetical protein J2P36_35285, partial [Ktedonobacteraceae bacterium]|nr:hypothetical protein [Ktedonobacteraceae bacterium]
SEMKALSNQPVTHVSQAEGRFAAPLHPGAEIDTMIHPTLSRGRQILRFMQHFGEMVLAMLLGMGILEAVLYATGIRMAPEVSALVMAVAMTIPMMVWMHIRKHSWRLNAEMAGAMIVPTAVLISVCDLGLLPRTSLMLFTHVLMLPAMLAVMLYRWSDYTHH